MADFDSIPDLDWSDLENVHERVGHMLHSFARLLPPVSETLELPSRPVPRESKKLPKHSGIPRHRDTWLQDMMNTFSSDPATAKNTTLETGGDGLMTSNESHPPFKPEDIAAQQAAELAQQQKEQMEQFQQGIGQHLTPESYHSAVMMAGGYSAAGPYSRTFPQLQQQQFMASPEQQKAHSSRTMMRRNNLNNNNRNRSMSPRGGGNNNNNNRNRSRSQHQNQRQGRARSNRNGGNNNNNRNQSNANNNNKRNQSNKNQQQQQKVASPSPAARDSSKPKVVPGAQVVVKPSKKQRQASKARAAEPEPVRIPQEGDRLYLYVEFKRGRVRKIPCDLPFGTVETGRYVIVVGDRDYDMGLVIGKEYVDKEDPSIRVGGIEWMDTVEPLNSNRLRNIRTEREPIIRLATADESNHLQNNFTVFEENAQKVCQYYCMAYGIDVEISDAELQFDGKKISFFFDAPFSIDFRNLVKDLHKVFNARIWMENVNDAQRSGQLQIPPRKGEGSTSRGASRNNRNSRRSPHARNNNNRGRSRGSRSYSSGNNRTESAPPAAATDAAAAASTNGEQQQEQQVETNKPTTATEE